MSQDPNKPLPKRRSPKHRIETHKGPGYIPTDNDRDRTVPGAIFTGILALAALALPFYAIYLSHGVSIGLFIALGFGLAYYLIIAYLVQLDPDLDSLAPNPFSLKNEVAEGEVIISILLMPGRMISIGLVDLFKVIFRR